MKQISLATTGFELVTKRTRKRVFMDEINLMVPWTELIGLIQPLASSGTTTKGGRPSFAVETMLRIHFLQQWFGLSDPAMNSSKRGPPTKYSATQKSPQNSHRPAAFLMNTGSVSRCNARSLLAPAVFGPCPHKTTFGAAGLNFRVKQAATSLPPTLGRQDTLLPSRTP